MPAERPLLHVGGRPRRAAPTAALLLLALAAPSCVPLDDAMAVVFRRSMRDQPSFDPYENPRMPPDGSVPFAAGNFPGRATDLNVGAPEPVDYDLPPFDAADMARGAQAAVAAGIANPVPASAESLARGEVMYLRFCAVCHGEQGMSAEAPMIQALPVMAAFNLATGAALNQPDGYIYGMIRVGRGLMPPYGHQVTHFDRWHIVNYIRQLQAQASGGPPPGAAPPAPGAPATAPGAAPDTAPGGN